MGIEIQVGGMTYYETSYLGFAELLDAIWNALNVPTTAGQSHPIDLLMDQGGSGGILTVEQLKQIVPVLDDAIKNMSIEWQVEQTTTLRNATKEAIDSDVPLIFA